MSTPFWVAGRPDRGVQELEVESPYDGAVVGKTTYATQAQVEEALVFADRVRGQLGSTAAYFRADVLDYLSRRLSERAEEAAQLITAESGKPIRWARMEVTRAVSTFRWGAEEARRWSGDLQRLDTDAASVGRMAMIRRFPKGPILGITPFNFPLNLIAHKLAPAIAVGAPIVIKPAPGTPLVALLLGELLAETDLPLGSWSVLPVPNERATELVTDPRLPVISFTGSVPVGWAIKEAAPRKHVTLELGGNAAAVICDDYREPEKLRWAAQRIATFGTYQAGQSCIAVQRVLIDRGLYDDFSRLLVEQVEALGTGDPADDATEVGPLINDEAARRVESWVAEAVQAGARVLAGGQRSGASFEPTVIEDVPLEAKVSCEEVFGPVLALRPIDGLDDAITQVNASRFGLQAGVFTQNLQTAFRCYRELEMGGVVIGDVPSYRADQLPYGGTKDSGVGREGLRAAMEDLTEERVLVLTGLSL